ncbi:MAG: hypothetical protein QXW48_04750, partial [Thermoplasmata archaeon]
MIEEIFAGILIVLSIFFIYISINSWRIMRERKYLFLMFVFFVFLLKGISYIFLMPSYIYPTLDAIVLIFLYIV